MRVQARITLPVSVRTAIDAVRLRWNPEVARGNPAHVTIVYHDEAPDPALLRERFEGACRAAAPFDLVLGEVRRFAAPDVGAFVEVADPGGGVARLRALVLAPPFSARSRFGLHVTLLHPLLGARIDEACPDLTALSLAGSHFVAEEIELIAGRGGATARIASLRLAGAGR